MRLAIAAGCLALVPRPAAAYRPFNGTDAAIAGAGQIELELAPLGFVKEGNERFVVAPSVIVNYGFAAGWEVVLEGRHFVQLGGEAQESRFRVEDTGLSVKHVVRDGGLQDQAGPSVATEIGLLLPTIQGEPGVGAQGTIIVSQRWPALTLHLNVAGALTRAHEPGLFVSTIVEGPDAWTVRPVAEVFVEAERGIATQTSGLAGAVWRVSEPLSLDAAARLATAGGTRTIELRAGLTVAFSP